MEEYGTLKEMFGPPGQVFVHEWAKYRYGVFEEHGYPGDDRYPMFYYDVEWNENGTVSTINPNFCSNNDIVDYEMIDVTTGGKCSYDSKSGLPDANCIPYLGKNNTISSSIMGIPYLAGNDQFCDDTEKLYHRSDIPTKHNDMCNGQSTFEVVKKHADFAGFKEGNKIADRKTTFEIVRPADSSSFVMVLDVSGSMDDNCKNKPKGCVYRIDRMKQSATRWINYDLEDNIPLGLVKFSSKATVMSEVKKTTAVNKKMFINLIDKLKADGGTCLGKGLKEGLNVLKRSGVNQGGVLIFLTDGVYQCPGGPTIDQVLPDLVKQGTRVITIAFSDNADPNIIKLAEATNGKSYFVPDESGPELINTALQGSLTYQPSVPSNQVKVIVLEETLKSKDNISLDFTIDELLGKNVTVQIDFSGNPGSTIHLPNNVKEKFTQSSGVYQHLYSDLAPGTYTVKITTSKPHTTINYASIKVTAKACKDIVPIMTRCWTNIGNSKADLANPNQKVYVMSEVLQGTNPVIGAKVVAYIERDDKPEPLEITLLDSGLEPDALANDGLYARYFTSFDPNKQNTRYTLKCQVESTENSKINEGFLESKMQTRSLPKKPAAGTPVCCGSNTIRENSILNPTGTFTRSSPGGSIQIVNADAVKFPPGKISNLRGTDNQSPGHFSLSFTSSGLRLDSGISHGLRVFYTSNSTLIVDGAPIMKKLPYLQVEDVVNPGSLVSQEPGTEIEIKVKRDKFKIGKPYFFRIVSFGADQVTWSNIAQVYLPKPRSSSAVINSSGTLFGLIVALSLQHFVLTCQKENHFTRLIIMLLIILTVQTLPCTHQI